MRLASRSLFVITFAAPLVAQNQPEWTEPFPAFHIAGNLYYVGSKGLASYLITTPQGHILINSDLQESVPLLRASVEKLGFKFSDIRILLISHAHWDHDAGSDSIKKLTGAKYMVMAEDVPVVESGGKADFQYGNSASTRYPATKVDRVLHDGDEVRLGDAVLVAHLTPGHTKGCTTWTMKVQEGGKTYNVVIVGSPNVNEGYKLVNNPQYPGIVADYERMFRVLKALPHDIYLGAHGSYFDLEAKYARSKGASPGAFVDPDGYMAFVADREQAYRKELAKQQAEATSQKPAVPHLDGKRLPLQTDTFTVYGIVGSDTVHTGSLTDELRRVGKHLVRVFHWDDRVLGVELDTTVMQLSDLAPVSYSSHSTHILAQIVFSAGKVTGWTRLPPGDSTVVNTTIREVTYDGTTYDLLARAGNLGLGFALTVPIFVDGPDTVATVHGRVTGSAIIQGHPCWVFDGVFVDLPVTFWIDKTTRALRQQLMSPAKDMGILFVLKSR